MAKKELSAQQLQKRIDLRAKKGLDSPNMQKRLDALNGASQPVAPIVQQTTQDSYNQNTQAANNYMGNLFSTLQSQGQFNPQGLPDLNRDYTQDRMRAEQSVMDSFNRNMNPQFDRQYEMFRQQMAEQGIDEGDEKYKNMYGDMMAGQNIARQNAANQAFQLGQAEQAQGFGQALSAGNQMYNQQYGSFQIPMQQINTMIPFYQQQGNLMQYQQGLDWQSNQANLNRQHDQSMAGQQHRYNMQLQAAAPRGSGGGGGSQPIWAQYGFSGPMEYDQYKFNQQMLLNQQGQPMQPRYPSAGNAAIAGFGQGAGAAIGSTLLR